MRLLPHQILLVPPARAEFMNERRKDGGGLIPADVSEQLERLVGEIEHMALIEKGVIGDRRVEHRFDTLRRFSPDRRGEHALRGVFFTVVNEAAEPISETLIGYPRPWKRS